MEKIVQGDSIARDITCPTVTDFIGWTGEWAISAYIGGPVLMSGELRVNGDRMECRVPPSGGVDVLPVGRCYLEIQVSNESLCFRKTLAQEPLIITSQTIFEQNI
jgi:hypothetical protein